jgi:DNA-binding GntR family transcriptional regulator
MCHAGKSMEMTHAKIIKALRDRDVEAARLALLDEIDSSRDEILDRVLQEESAYWHLDAARMNYKF